MAAVLDLQRFLVVALPLADLAGDVDIGQEVHLDLDDAVPLAVLAAAALDVEAEATRFVAAHPRLRQLGEKVADVREHAGIGGRVGPGGAADRRLVDIDHLVDEAQPRHLTVRTRPVLGPVEVLGEALVHDVAYQCALARAADAGDADQLAEREIDIDVLQVVFGGAAYHQHRPVALAPPGREWDAPLAPEEGPGQRLRLLDDVVEGAGGDDPAAMLTGAGAYIHDEVGGAHGLLVMLDNHHRITDIAQSQEGVNQLAVVLLVQPDGRLVQDIEDAHQLGPDLGRQPDPLRLTARKRVRRAGEGEVFEADVHQELQPLPDLFEDRPGDHGVPLAQAELDEPFAGR